MLPVAEHDGGAAGAQVLADGGDEDGQQRSTGVAVLHEGQTGLAHGGRCEDEGRVGGDQIECATGQGLEERAADQLEAIGVGAGQGRVEGGEGQSALGDVGGGHAVGVSQEVKGLNAAAAAEVQGRGDGVARGEGGQCQARPTDAENVVGGELATGGELAQVGGDPPAHVAVAVVGLVRAQIDGGAHDGRGRRPGGRRPGIGGGGARRDGRRLRGGARRRGGVGGVGVGGLVPPDGDDEAHGECSRGAGAPQHRVELLRGDGLAEHEQRGQNGCGTRIRAGGAVLGEHGAQGPHRREEQIAAQGVVGDRAQEVPGGLHAPARGLEVGAQGGDPLGRGGGSGRRRGSG